MLLKLVGLSTRIGSGANGMSYATELDGKSYNVFASVEEEEERPNESRNAEAKRVEHLTIN